MLTVRNARDGQWDDLSRRICSVWILALCFLPAMLAPGHPAGAAGAPRAAGE